MRIIHDEPGVGCGCCGCLVWTIVAIGLVVFWGFIYYSAAHFILKYW